MRENEWLDMLLEAEPDELRGLGDSPLARRVREDPVVRAAARQIIDALNVLNAGLATAADRAATRPVIRPSVHALAERRPRRSRAGRVAVALAAAAAIVLLLARPPARGPGAPQGADRETALTAQLDASADRSFAVFATRNPDIAIVWMLEEAP